MVLFPKLKLLHRHQQHHEIDSVPNDSNVFSIIIISQTLRRQTKSHFGPDKTWPKHSCKCFRFPSPTHTMSEDMSSSGSSWNLRHLLSASSRLISNKGGYPDPRSTTTSTSRGLEGTPAGEYEKKSWRAWAEKIRGKRKGSDGVGNVQVINVFPGWATRRYARGTNTEGK